MLGRGVIDHEFVGEVVTFLDSTKKNRQRPLGLGIGPKGKRVRWEGNLAAAMPESGGNDTEFDDCRNAARQAAANMAEYFGDGEGDRDDNESDWDM